MEKGTPSTHPPKKKEKKKKRKQQPFSLMEYINRTRVYRSTHTLKDHIGLHVKDPVVCVIDGNTQIPHAYILV